MSDNRPLLLFALFLNLLSLVSATHFAYGTYQWTLLTGNYSSSRTYDFQIELAFRRSFPWSPAPPGSSIPPNVGDTVNVGSTITFYPMGTGYTGNAPYSFQIYLIDQVNYLNDDWFSGTQDISLNIKQNTDQNWRHYYSSCCRLSSIRDRNNDTPWTLTGVINRYGTYSPRVTGLPRIWFILNTPNLYTIPVVLPVNVPVTYKFAVKLESTLNYPYPVQPSGGGVVTVTNYNSGPFQLNSITGECVWTPQNTGLYALAFIIEEQCTSTQGTVCTDAVPAGGSDSGNGVDKGTSQANCCSRVPFDFIFQVVTDCTGVGQGCAVPPYFYEPFPVLNPPLYPAGQWNFTRGIQGTFMVCAKDNDPSQTVLIDHSIFPANSNWVLDFQGNPTCYFYSWTPGLTDVDQIICFYATAIPNQAKSTGQYCIRLHILPGNCIAISGIIRDFHYYHPNFNHTYSDSLEKGIPNWVSTTLSNIWLPVFQAGSPAPVYVTGVGLQTSPTNAALNENSALGFYDWYNTDNPSSTAVGVPGFPGGPRNLATASQQLFCSGINNNNQIFTFLQSAFFPIDGMLFGNEGDIHNYFFTYEINTYITYATGLIFNLQSDDDLWVFIDGVLPNNPTWNLYGIKTDNTSTSPPQAKGYSINVDKFALTHPLKLNETYRCDVFYAQRMHRTPYLKLEFPNSTLCDALSAVSNFLFNYSPDFSNTTALTSFYFQPSSSNPSKIVSATYNGTSYKVIQLTDHTTTTKDSQAAVWYGNPPQKVKASHGFVTVISFWIANNPTSTGAPEGFAFVLGTQYTPGGSGPNLGYAGVANNFAVEFDTALSASMSDVSILNQTTWYSEIAYHYVVRPAVGSTTAPPFDVNSATEKGSLSGLVPGGVNDGTIYLNMQNGTLHTATIEYQPGTVDLTNPAAPVYNPGWMRVFMSTPYGVQLAPVTEFQLSGQDMANILTGSCYIGLTAGLSSAQGVADIFIKSWNFKYVPTDPASTTYLYPAYNIIAGNTGCVTVQAKDACGNIITVGGEAASFNASYTPQFCQEISVPMTPIDNGNGTYTFCYNPVIQGTYQISITFEKIPIANGQVQRFQVIHAPAVPSNTFTTWGELPDCYNDPGYCVGPTNGVFVARFTNLGHLTGNAAGTYGKVFDFSLASGYTQNVGYDGGVAEFQQFISGLAKTDYLAIATSGNNILATNMQTAAGYVTGLGLATTQMKNWQSGNTFAFIGSQQTPLVNSSCSGTPLICEQLTNTGTASISARGTDASSVSLTRHFTLTAISANAACGPYAKINSVYDDIRLPAGQTDIFSVVAKDPYGNLCDDAAAAIAPPVWNPDFTQPAGNRPAGTLTGPTINSVSGYYQFQFLSYRAGVYQVNIYLNNQNINGSYYTVTITPGLANVTTSSGSGPALTTATAGVNATFTLNLADKVNNTINFQNPQDQISGTVYMLNNGVPTGVAIPITLTWVNDPVSGCTACILQATYYATVASNASISYVMNFTMNGGTATYALPNVVPGPLSPPNCTFNLGSLAQYNPAGTPIQFTIQAKDRFGNLRTIPNSAGDTFVVVPSPTANIVGGASGVSVNYAGSGGIYNAMFTPKIKGPLSLAVQVTATGADPYLPQGVYNVGTITTNIVAGPADPTVSYVQNMPTQQYAGVFFGYNIYSFDQYGNFRNNQPFNYAVAQASDYVPRTYLPPATDAVTVAVNTTNNFGTTGIFEVDTNATVAGAYTVQVQTGLASTVQGDVTGSASASDSPAPTKNVPTPYQSVQVVPAPTWGANTQVSGTGILGGKSGTQTWFLLTAYDLYQNQEIDYHDHTSAVVPVLNPNGGLLYSVTISGVCLAPIGSPQLCTGPANAPTEYSSSTQATITNGPTPGTYNVTYTVPTNQISDSSPWQDFNITVAHTGGGITWPYTVGPWSKVYQAVSNQNPLMSCAILYSKNGTAGSLSFWNITDFTCGNNPVPRANSVGFTVTLTRVNPNDLQTIGSPITVACNGCTTSGQFTVKFTPTLYIGTFQVRVFSQFVETNQSIAGIYVGIGPGPVYPPNCHVNGFPGTVVAGTPFSFTATLADQWYHPIGQGKTFITNATGPSGRTASFTSTGTWSAANGNYTFTTGSSLTVAGLWNVDLWETTSMFLQGVDDHIGGQQLYLTVIPGRIYNTYTYATFPARTLAPSNPQSAFETAGTFGYFTIYPEDQYGNSLTYPDVWTGPTTQAAITLSDNVAGTQPPNGPSAFTITADQDPNKPGRLIFTVGYNATKIMTPNNNINVQVTVGGTPTGILGQGLNSSTPSPFSVLVVPAKISASLSKITVTNQQVTAGNPISFQLQAVDIWGNAWYSDQQNALNALVQIPGSAGVGTTQQASVAPVSGQAGTYLFTLPGADTHQASGWTGSAYQADYNVSLNWVSGANSQLLTGTGGLSIPSFTVVAGPTDPTQTIAPTLTPVIASIPRTYTVITVDQYGNRRWQGTMDQVGFIFYKGNVDCSGDNVVPIDATSNFTINPSVSIGQGAYNVTFEGKISGIYTLNITVTPNLGTPGSFGPLGVLSCPQVYKLIQQVLPGPAYPPECWYTISPCDYVAAGSKISFFLQLNDMFGNAIMRSGSQWAVGYYNVPGANYPSPLAQTLQAAGGPYLDDTSTLPSGWALPAASQPWLNPGTTPYNGSQTLTPPPAIIDIKDFGNSSYSFTVQVFTAGFTGIVISCVNASSTWVMIPPPSCFSQSATEFGWSTPVPAVEVVSGVPRQFTPYPPTVFTSGSSNQVTAAIPTQFTLQAKDYWGNDVTNSTNQTYAIVVQNLANGYTMDITTGPAQPNGQTTVDVESAWNGNFSLSITMYPNSPPGTDATNSNSAVSPAAVTVNVLHATCAYDTPSKPYRCPDRSCVAQYSDCPNLNGDTCGSQTYCATGGCVAPGGSCKCPSGTVACGSSCAVTCPPADAVCGGTSPYKCSDGYCRASSNDCPSPAVCAPGYALCPDGTSCARNISSCSTLYATPCSGGKFRCGTGQCVLTLDDCPSPVSCGASMVYCLSDGSCQTDRSKCPDQYLCYSPNSYRCGDGTCVTTSDQCPTSVTCLAGFVMCEDGRCVPSVASCPSPIICPLNQTRCPDGSCQNNLLFCPSSPNCNTTTPILCWDGSCVTFSSDCTYPKTCPGTTFNCPGGSCAATQSQCPTPTRCPDSTPLLCSDGSCQNSTADCPILPVCPVQTPIRCPDGQSCRAQLSDCPTIVTCQPTQVKCSDGTCSIALDKCAPVAVCPSPNVRCGGGACVASYDLCPTDVTCPVGYAKCTDGSCHGTCPTTYQQCAQGLVTCPQASAGIQCAPYLTACPTSFICPYPTTVRCIDSSCALTSANCPTPPPDSDYITNKVPCADGTYAADPQSCPTPVTCASSTPYVCADGTCRIALADCPVPTACPRDASGNTQYRCSNGACSTLPWDPVCTSAASPCALSTPFQCQSGNCVANASICDTYPNPILNCTSNCQICPDSTWTYCQSGVCVQNSADCASTNPGCPASLPTLCPNGLCSAGNTSCPAANGCPASKPQKCPISGACVASLSSCPSGYSCAATYGSPYTQSCPDGSCIADTANCPSANGCPSSSMTLCFDGTCALSCTNPVYTQGTTPPNACPESDSFMCLDGFCAKSSTACPYQLVNANCSGSTPFQCAIGSCVTSSTQCPPVAPCPTDYVRCADGTCRQNWTSNANLPTCPLVNTCPTGSTRCSNGLCSTDASLCDISPLTGCPAAYVKCPSGQCASSQSTCNTLPAASGCPTATPNKCYNGECKATSAECLLPNGCPQTASIRCPYGDCQSDPTKCASANTAGNTTQCADGSWASSVANCPGLNQCPVATPFRCADGSCSAASALSGGCSPVVTCTGTDVLCADGSCQSSTAFCSAQPPCALTLCPDFSCQATCNTSTPRCVSTNPILCASGACVVNLAACGSSTGGPTNQNCPAPNVTCYDQLCVSSQSQCITRGIYAQGKTPNSQDYLTGVCPLNGVMCPDGSCQRNSWECPIIARCPFGQYRCPDGSCGNPSNPAHNPCATKPACGTGYTRCEDGFCRPKTCTDDGLVCTSQCLMYDGCGLANPYHCLNRECGGTTAGCANAALGNPTLKTNFRRLLGQSLPTPCLPWNTTNGFCYGMIKAALTSITVDTTQSSTVDIALDENNIPRLTLIISSGAFVLKDGGTITSIAIRPVGESRMRYAINEIQASRRIQFGSFLPFSMSVLTPAFECQVDPNVIEPFNINVTVQAYFDKNPPFGVNASDICLARLVELPGFVTWRCLFPSAADRDTTGTFYVQKDPTLPTTLVESVISFCTPQTSVETGVQSTSNGTVYAFIWSPIPKTPTAPTGPDVIQKNIVWIILGVLLGIAGLVLLAYCAFRLFRYRAKYKEQKEEADRLQEEVENMRQFGGEAGNKDDQVNMTKNPLTVQLQDVQARFNEEDLKLQAAEADLRKQEGEIRQEHIKNMRENRDQLASQLEKLKRQLAETQAANAPKPTFEEDTQGGASYATDEPIREEFDGGQSSGAQPRRQKRDI